MKGSLQKGGVPSTSLPCLLSSTCLRMWSTTLHPPGDDKAYCAGLKRNHHDLFAFYLLYTRHLPCVTNTNPVYEEREREKDTSSLLF